MSNRRDDDEFEKKLDEVAQSLRDVADQISALRDYVPRRESPTSEAEEPQTEQAAQPPSTSEAPEAVSSNPQWVPAEAPEQAPPSERQATHSDGAASADDDRAEDIPPARGTPAYRPSSAGQPPRRGPVEAEAESDPAAEADAARADEASEHVESDDAPEVTTEPESERGQSLLPDPKPAAEPEPEPAASTDAPSGATPPPPDAASPSEPNEDAESTGFRVENWIDKIGIALVLLGVAFLYQLSVEMGLITPPIKVVLGGVVSTVLLGVGLKIRKKRHGLAQIMMGGASAGYYLSVFAASQLYELISDPVALGATLGVAAGTFGLAIREDTPALTVVGAIGAFATPFFLEATSAGQLLAFNAIIVTGMTSVYAYKGWTALLLTYASGAWMVVLYAIVLHMDEAFGAAGEAAASADTLAQIGLTAVWLATGVVPTVRSWLNTRRDGELDLESGSLDTLLVFGMALLGPVLYQIAAHLLWDWSDITWVIFDVGWAIATGVLAWRLAEVESDLFAAAFRFVALMFATMALFEFFDDQWLAAALAIEGAAVCYSGRRLDDDLLRSLGHLMLVGTSLFLLTTLDFTAGSETAFLNGEFLRAAIIIGALVAVSLDEESDLFVLGYRYVAHGLILLVVLDQSMAIEYGQLVCTAIWGGYAIGVLVGGTVSDSRQATLVGFLTIVLTATKLIAFDMADTETIWRVAVFIGFGGALLLTSYLVPGLAGGSREEEGRDADDDEAEVPEPSGDGEASAVDGDEG